MTGFSDPDRVFELMAIMGVATLIKNGIDFSQGVLSHWWMAVPFLTLLFKDAVKQAQTDENAQSELLEWMTSLGVAWLIVKNFDKILDTTNNILGLASRLLALPVK